MNKKLQQWAVLAVMLLLPFLIYMVFVYSAKENFFTNLEFVGPQTITEIQLPDGNVQFDTLPYKIPHWSFANELGLQVSSDAYKGKIYLANFFFTRCPSICPSMNFQVLQFQERFSGFKDFKIVSFTVDPSNDSAQALHSYSIRMKANNEVWNFYTGGKVDLYKTASHYLQSAQEDASAPGGFLHTEQLVLVDWEGRIRSRKDENGNVMGSYNALLATDVKMLMEDIKVLIAEFEKHKSMLEYREQKKNKSKYRD